VEREHLVHRCEDLLEQRIQLEHAAELQRHPREDRNLVGLALELRLELLCSRVGLPSERAIPARIPPVGQRQAAAEERKERHDGAGETSTRFDQFAIS
jgi:hypothetical protein